MNRFVRVLFVLGLAVSTLALFAWAPAQASNMAFKLNKPIHPLAAGGKGRNYVAFPDRGPHQGAGGLTNICTSLQLNTGTGTITQLNSAQGTVNTFQCGQLETFSFMNGVGAIITDTTAAGGIIVGADTPGNQFSFTDLGSPPIGYNIFPVEYHTTAVTPEDLCGQCALSGTASVTRYDALNGLVQSHVCGQLPLWNLELGEAVLILEPNGPKTCTPPHF